MELWASVMSLYVEVGVFPCEPALKAQVTLWWDRVLTLNRLGKPQLSKIVWREWISPCSFPGLIK